MESIFIFRSITKRLKRFRAFKQKHRLKGKEMKYFLIIFSLFMISCQGIKYVDDNGFISSAQANSMEFPISINGKMCKDVDGNVGLCAKRIASNKDLIFSIPERPYSYHLDVVCSRAIDYGVNKDVPKDKPFSFTISHESYSVKSFTCNGEIFPEDRSQEVSSSWQLRAIVVDSKYKAREKPHVIVDKDKKYLVLGRYAKYSSIDSKKLKKKTIVRIKSEPDCAFSESERMRFNYYGKCP